MPGSKKIKEINAAPMADIAFLLLIFFLVTTTLDTDSGIMRRLPPMPREEDMQNQDRIRERNVFLVMINKNNELLVELEPTDITQLRERAKEFIANPNDDPSLPEKTVQQVPFFGTVDVCNKGVISVQNDRGTSYKMYLQVQNELVAAYNELRNELAMQKFGEKFDDLPEDQQEAIRTIFPLNISEAEPKNVGGQ